MFVVLIVMSAVLPLVWLSVWVYWRKSRAELYWLNVDGFIERNVKGVLPATAGMTFFIAGGWSLYLSPTGSGGESVGIGRYIGAVLVGFGLIFSVFFLIVYQVGRPLFIIPPAMRPSPGGKEKVAGKLDACTREGGKPSSNAAKSRPSRDGN